MRALTFAVHQCYVTVIVRVIVSSQPQALDGDSELLK
jgi:hypothetical protein